MESSVLVAAAVWLLVILILRWVSGARGRNKPPGPWNLPIVGYLPFLSRAPYIDLQRLAKKYGDVFSIQLGSRYVVVLNDFESTKDAFARVEFFARPDESPFLFNKETIDTKAFNGLPWKVQRRVSLHHLRNLGLGKSKMEGHIQEEIDELLEHYGRNVGKPFLAREYLAPSMSNNITALMFGKRYKYSDPLRQMMSRITNVISRAAGQDSWLLFFPWLRKASTALGIGDVYRVSKIAEELGDYAMKEINENEATLNPNEVRNYIDGYLLEMRKRKDDPSFSKVVLQDMVGNFLGAGSETVRHSVDWLILTVATQQEGQRRIQAEIDEVIGCNRHPIWSDQKSMPYTEAFITELNRWRTIIPLNLLRYTLADTELKGYFIPKHTQVLSNLWAVHHDEEYWGMDVEEFRPERFLTEDGKAFKKWEHYIPFSIGKRSCPGEPLAKIEVFLYFVSILQKFDIRLPDGKSADFDGDLGIVLRPKPQEVIMTKRN